MNHKSHMRRQVAVFMALLLFPLLAIFALTALSRMGKLPGNLLFYILGVLLIEYPLALVWKKWSTRAMQEALDAEKGAELPKEAPPLFQALIDDYMQNDLATLTDLLQPLGWTTDYPPADVEGCIVTDYEKGEHELYLEFSADEIRVSFDEATANIVETAPLDMARFADARAVYDYVASLCEHYFP